VPGICGIKDYHKVHKQIFKPIEEELYKKKRLPVNSSLFFNY